MILDQLVLENVGVFAGRNEIDLAPSPGQPIILFGGLNGAGKTTILESIHLALYGHLAVGSPRRTGSYETYLRSLIHRPVEDGATASLELAFHAFTEGRSRSYRVQRTWREGSSGISESVQATIDDQPDQTLTETWAEFIEGFLPRGIAGLFFFDGEQIESLASLDRSRQVLASALAALLGLDLVDRLGADLAVLRRRRGTAEAPQELRQRMEETKTAFDAARRQEQDADDAEKKARQERDRADKHQSEAKERYRANGGDLFEQKAKYENRVSELREELEALDERLRGIAAKAAPFLQVAQAVRELAAQAHREFDAVREQIVLDVLGRRDRDLIDELAKFGAEQVVLKTIRVFLDEDRHNRREAASADQVSGLTTPAPVDFLADGLLPAALDDARETLAERMKADARLENAQRLLEGVPDEEALRPFRQAYDEARDEQRRALGAFVRAEERHKTLSEQRERAQATHLKALDTLTLASLDAEDDKRFVKHADKVRATLDELKVAATRKHVDHIATLVLESLRVLMRKENLVTHVAIDPATYAVELRGSTGQPVSPEQFSVGERQMLAVALLWGLAKAADQPLPVVIDTPLGRLDSSHRENLLDRYFPYASDQVILLSTDTEINGEAWKHLRSYVGRAYRLEFDRKVGATTVHAGYFWES